MRYAIGIDLGGTKIAGAIVDENGTIMAQEQAQTSAASGKLVILHHFDRIITDLIDIAKKKKLRLEGIGIGVPGTFDEKGTLRKLPNVQPLEGFNMRGHCAEKHKFKTFLENDARCFAIAEFTIGAGMGSENMIGVIMGTGIGSGIIINGDLYRGANGSAGEIGHVIVDLKSKRLDAGKNDWECLIAGPAISKRYKQHGGTVEKNFSEIWHEQSDAAKKTREETIQLMSIFFGNLALTFNPECIVVGGGVSNTPFYAELNKRVKECSVAPVKIVPAKLKDAGVIGAAAIAFS
jgi:glucokinase